MRTPTHFWMGVSVWDNLIFFFFLNSGNQFLMQPIPEINVFWANSLNALISAGSVLHQ